MTPEQRAYHYLDNLRHLRKLKNMPGDEGLTYLKKIAPTLFDIQYWFFLRIVHENSMGSIVDQNLLMSCFEAQREFREIGLMNEHERQVLKNWPDDRVIYCAVPYCGGVNTFEWYLDYVFAYGDAALKTFITGEKHIVVSQKTNKEFIDGYFEFGEIEVIKSFDLYSNG